MKKRNPFVSLIKLVALGAVIGGVIGFSVPFTTGWVIPNIEKTIADKNDEAEKTETVDDNGTVNVANLASLDEASRNTIELVKKVKPSVVCITTKTTTQDWFYQTYESEGAGSGVIFHEDDSNVYIVTNAHVVSGANSVLVSVSDSDLVQAELVGKDVNADLAVISVSKEALNSVGITGVTVAAIGSSSALQVGESVIAIGNALGEGNTATAGIVSALSKDVNIQGRKLTVIQTDAAINPGNSGGALINSKGEVIGINTAKLAITSVEGIGYSIASDVAKPIIEQMMNTESTPALGITVVNVSQDDAATYNLPAGVLVEEVAKDSAAQKAGIKSGDTVTAFNGSPVFTSEQLLEAIRKCAVGDTVSITIVRDGESKTVSARLMKANQGF